MKGIFSHLALVLALLAATVCPHPVHDNVQRHVDGFFNIFQNIFSSPVARRPPPTFQIRTLTLACVLYNIGCPSWYATPSPTTTLAPITTTTTPAPPLFLRINAEADGGADANTKTMTTTEGTTTTAETTTTTSTSTSTTLSPPSR